MPDRFDPEKKKGKPMTRVDKIRNLVGFWFLGLTNNFAYVVMLSAAHDLLKTKNSTASEETNNNNFTCNPVSTGAILLADILPSLFIKLVSPFFFTNTHARVLIAVLLSGSSFIMTSLSYASWMTYLGVVCAALSSGLGEVTFLRFSSHFDRNVVSTWSSGTGGAGVLGAFLYTFLNEVGMSPRLTLKVMLIIPIIEAFCFWILIRHPPSTRLKWLCNCNPSQTLLPSTAIVSEDQYGYDPIPSDDTVSSYSLLEKICLIKPLLKYMIPLSLVYFFEYFINQGLTELLFFRDSVITNLDNQYRWYSVLYQVGVFISRSSANIFVMKKLWILAVLQGLNVAIFLLQVIFQFIPSIWVVFALIIYEGLLGGCAYVSTFFRISKEIWPQHREFSMGVASVGDAMGITFAAMISLPIHNSICDYLLQKRQ